MRLLDLCRINGLAAGAVGASFLAAGECFAPSDSASPPARDVEIEAAQNDPVVASVGRNALAKLNARRASVSIKQFPLSDSLKVDLEVQRFRVTGPDTKFVIGGGGANDRPLEFDADRIVLLRGNVVGYPNSHVLLALSDWGSTGSIDLGEAGRRYVLSPYEAGGDAPGAFQMRVSRSRHWGGLLPGVPLCGVSFPRDAEVPGGIAGGGVTPEVTQQIELAIETDYEYYERFGDLDAAAAYVVQLYAAVSDVYLRDVNTRVKVTFVRLWDTPQDLFNEPDPLLPFRNYWNSNMTGTHRDVAQFLSGRRDLPYGGVAWLSALCTSSGYSVVGYILGFFTEGLEPGVYQYDVFVTAHELGHNCGAAHTHGYGIDNCDDVDGPPQRGTIMSYCSQTVSGGNANTDLRFHAVVQPFMRDHIFSRQCIAADCNGNGIADVLDIAQGSSPDANANGIPDECEDCNGNGTLDDIDIAQGQSFDLNGNGVPDECEPDCNGNGAPDDLDILSGVSFDLHGNNIPDECEADCNGDGVADYNEIQVNMALDLDRSAVLDACQDCDGDGISDLDTLDGAHHAWVASLMPGAGLSEFHSLSGVLVKSTAQGTVNGPQDVVITSNGRILVSSANDDRIVEFNGDGLLVGDFVATGSGGLDYPTGMVIAPSGNLLACSRDTNSVLEYDGGSGAFVRTLVASGAGGLLRPFGIAFGPNGNLFVTSSDDRVIEYVGQTGVLVGDFVSALDNGGLDGARGIVFKPDGRLLVASFLTNEILEYDAGTGVFLGRFNHGGTETALVLDGPWCLRIGRDARVYVSRHLVGGPGGHAGAGHDEHKDIQNLHINTTRIYIFDVDGGAFVRSYVMGNDTGLGLPTGFDFMPGADVDCNFNQIPDSCDIDQGTSQDANGDGIPDECGLPNCLADLNGDGKVNSADLTLLLGAWAAGTAGGDIDGDGVTNSIDLTLLLGVWAAGGCV